MALTNTILKRNVIGNQRLNTVSVVFDTSYPTGGEAFTAADAGLTRIDNILPVSGASGYWVEYTAGKLVLADDAAAEVANGLTMGDMTLTLLVIGE